MQDLRQFGRKKGWCPYYLARHMLSVANVVVYNYQYMLDPKVSQMVRAACSSPVLTWLLWRACQDDALSAATARTFKRWCLAVRASARCVL